MLLTSVVVAAPISVVCFGISVEGKFVDVVSSSSEVVVSHGMLKAASFERDARAPWKSRAATVTAMARPHRGTGRTASTLPPEGNIPFCSARCLRRLCAAGPRASGASYPRRRRRRGSARSGDGRSSSRVELTSIANPSLET